MLRRFTSHAASAYLVALVVVALPLFAHLNTLPVRLWDESRPVFNALEMARGEGQFLVPTYGGAPEMWNTKPPLLIWIQALFIRLIGEGELAVRLPSALAALATCLLLVRFAQKWLGRPWLGVLAVGVLASARGYVSLHGVRTGDYEALTTLFTTGYGLAWFLYCERGNRGMLWTAAACIAGAALTKGVGGLLPLPAIVLYSVFSGRILRQLRNPSLYLSTLCIATIVGGYYLAREAINPGYIEAVRINELGGRFTEVNEAHGASWNWYVDNLLGYRFRPWMLWWIAGMMLGAFSRDRVLRRATLFSTLFCIVHLIVISSAATKLEWYDLPVYPFAALLAGYALSTVAAFLQKLLARKISGKSAAASAVGLVLLAFVFPYRATLIFVFERGMNHWDPPAETYAAEFLQEVHRGERHTRLDAFVWKNYSAHIAWYRAVMHGVRNSTQSDDLAALRPGQQVYTFEPEVQKLLTGRYAADTVETYKETVVIYRIRGRK